MTTSSVHQDRVRVGVGLPNTIPGVQGATLIDWARIAESRGFSSLGTVDRLVYDSYDPLIALSAVAAVTSQIELATSILIAPIHPTALLAKQAASLDRISGGRLTLGLGLGGRSDDYEALGTDTKGRGRKFDVQLGELRHIWNGRSGIGPTPSRRGRPRLLIGGDPNLAGPRVARHGEGWTMTATTPAAFAAGRDVVEAEWDKHHRQGKPFCQALFYFALGSTAERAAREAIGSYYAWLGKAVANQIAAGAATSESMVQTYVGELAQAGADEVLAIPCIPDAAQVDQLADVLGSTLSPAVVPASANRR